MHASTAILSAAANFAQEAECTQFVDAAVFRSLIDTLGLQGWRLLTWTCPREPRRNVSSLRAWTYRKLPAAEGTNVHKGEVQNAKIGMVLAFVIGRGRYEFVCMSSKQGI
jgi:hypothetical protein